MKFNWYYINNLDTLKVKGRANQYLTLKPKSIKSITKITDSVLLKKYHKDAKYKIIVIKFKKRYGNKALNEIRKKIPEINNKANRRKH